MGRIWIASWGLAGVLWGQPSAFEMAGIRLGMPLKEAMMALKKHRHDLKLATDSIPYGAAGAPLTYGIHAVGPAEGFYFLVTMPPNQVVVSKVTWVARFSPDSPPTQQDVVARLVAKYGPPSFDTLDASLTMGSREVWWVDDGEGKRTRGNAHYQRCRGESTFFLNGRAAGTRAAYDPVNVRLPGALAKARLEQGYKNQYDEAADFCGGFTVVRARLFDTRELGVKIPNLVSYLVLMMASGPLDRESTNATHEWWKAKR